MTDFSATQSIAFLIRFRLSTSCPLRNSSPGSALRSAKFLVKLKAAPAQMGGVANGDGDGAGSQNDGFHGTQWDRQEIIWIGELTLLSDHQAA
ncbi:MAG: hypothetical protein WBP25_01845 [Giesbergeria sp.]